MNFKVGQEVVCIDDDFDPRCHVVADLPKKGEVYTVRETLHTKHWPAIRLLEIAGPAAFLNELTGLMVEAAFPQCRFRLVDKKKTDISIFTKMLKPKQRENADVH